MDDLKLLQTMEGFTARYNFLKVGEGVFEGTRNDIPFRVTLTLVQNALTEHIPYVHWRMESLLPDVPFLEEGMNLSGYNHTFERAFFAQEIAKYGEPLILAFDLVEEIRVRSNVNEEERDKALDVLLEKASSLSEDEFEERMDALLSQGCLTDDQQWIEIKQNTPSNLHQIVKSYWTRDFED